MYRHPRRGAGSDIDSMVQVRLIHPEGGEYARELAVLPLAGPPLGRSLRGRGYTKETANPYVMRVAEKTTDTNGREAVTLHLDSKCVRAASLL
eukprot:7437784-Pyramimonas_sp.AAC.1